MLKGGGGVSGFRSFSEEIKHFFLLMPPLTFGGMEPNYGWPSSAFAFAWFTKVEAWERSLSLRKISSVSAVSSTWLSATICQRICVTQFRTESGLLSLTDCLMMQFAKRSFTPDVKSYQYLEFSMINLSKIIAHVILITFSGAVADFSNYALWHNESIAPSESLRPCRRLPQAGAQPPLPPFLAGT